MAQGVQQIMMVDKALLAVAARVVFYTLLWYTFSIGITFYNKWLFQWYGFHFPLIVTTAHMTCTFGWSALARWYLARFQGVKYTGVTWRNILFKVAPAGAAGALDIGLSNAAIATKMHINLYTICKSTVVCFVLFFSFIWRLQKPTWELAGIVALIVGGVILFQAQDDLSFHSSGFFLVMLASMFGGLRWVLTQVLLKSSSFGLNGTIDTLFHIAPTMAVTLFPFAMASESERIARSPMLFGSPDVAMTTLLAVLMGTVLAFCLTISEFLLVEYAGSLTLTIAGVFKELVTLLLAASTVRGNELSPVNLLGLFVSLLGIGGYNYIKYRDAVKPGGYARVRQTDDDGEGTGGVGGSIQMQSLSSPPASPSRSSPVPAVTRAQFHVTADGLSERLVETEM
eukprot:m.209280 g.209280  ORF g.209280 m.209280 type:complete len:398 (+) comp24531_c0_seq1:281-1474(+)